MRLQSFADVFQAPELASLRFLIEISLSESHARPVRQAGNPRVALGAVSGWSIGARRRVQHIAEGDAARVPCLSPVAVEEMETRHGVPGLRSLPRRDTA